MKKPKRKRIRVPDPFARELVTNPYFRTKTVPSGLERDEKRDQWARKAKHKGQPPVGD